MGWWIFLLGGLLTLIITVSTVSMLAFKAATLNPAKSLRANT
jgi:putative ABC transport system permease protein